MLRDLFEVMDRGVISGKLAKDVFNEMMVSGKPARQVIDERELDRRYGGDPDAYLAAMGASSNGSGSTRTGGHVGTLRFDSEQELEAYLESLGDEIAGFYGCRSESRPYNF